MNDSEISLLDLRRYISLLWHRAWLLALLTVIPAVAMYFYASQQPSIYQASTLVLVNESSGNTDASMNLSTVTTSKLLAETYSRTMTTRSNLEEVSRRLGLPRVTSSIDVQLIKDTQLIMITVEDLDAQRAADVANMLVTVFSERNLADQVSRSAALRQNLENQLALLQKQIQETNTELSEIPNQPSNQVQRDQLSLLLSQYRQSYTVLTQSYMVFQLSEARSVSSIIQKEPAIKSTFRVRPRPSSSAIQAGLLGFVLAVALVFLLEFLNDTIQSPQEFSERYGLPVLGVIMSHQAKGQKLITLNEPRSPVSEAFRSLRTNLKFASVDKPLQVLLVTSASPEDGKSTVAANLAVCLAQSDLKVILLEADLRKPMVHRKIGVSNRVGVTEIFTQPNISLNGNLQTTEVPTLYALTSGALPPNPSELLGSAKMVHIIEHLRAEADFIVVDSPPVTAVTDAAVLSAHVDGVLLVARPGATKIQAFRQALEQMQRVKANLLGVVLNDVEMKHAGYRYYYRGYYHSDQYYQAKAPQAGILSKVFGRWRARSVQAEDQKGESI